MCVTACDVFLVLALKPNGCFQMNSLVGVFWPQTEKMCFCADQRGQGLTLEQHLQTMVVYLPDGEQGRQHCSPTELHLAAVLFPTVILACVCVFVWSELWAVGWQAGGSFSVAL